MDFPRLVFISPGKLACNGGTYAHELVDTQESFDAAIKAGFFSTIPEALAWVKAKSIAPATEDTSKDDAETSDLDALIAKAESLRIKVDKRWKANRLVEEIAKIEEV